MGKAKKKKFSVARELDCLEERLTVCKDSLENVDFRLRKEELSPEGRKSLEEEKLILLEQICKYEKELVRLRKENRKNMLLSVALLALLVFLYFCWGLE
ncbi:coiled-coil domain-containing protein 167 [Latimeria chalumnae]|nr:PREDICTED: coiled-coil domain-containing protein 167 [Latimeria chalumnae]XP_006010748.1 PREDICTED: coiled-coil domain-containing protein 167 [Latimeria chalumnae]|eukprot:XP_006010747.1 PREDICTED: coiled-coil domain-containing protein 167 [Latimeria chalumnae]